MKFLEAEINEKIFKRLAIVGLILIFLFALIVLIQYSMLKPYTLGNNTTVDDVDIVESVAVNKGTRMIEIVGYAYKTGENVETFNSSFILKNKESGKMYKMHTTMEKRLELMAVDEIYDCSNCGMIAKSFTIGLKPGIYDVCIAYNNNGHDIFSETGIEVEIN